MKKLLFVFAIGCSLHTMAQKTYLHCGKLIDAVSNTTLSSKTIVVENNKIVDVLDGYTAAGSNDKVIDLQDKTVMPGLMDMHVHMETQTKRNSASERFTKEPQDIAFQSVNYALVTLMAGFTTVRDLGGSRVNISLRNAINNGTTSVQGFIQLAGQLPLPADMQIQPMD